MCGRTWRSRSSAFSVLIMLRYVISGVGIAERVYTKISAATICAMLWEESQVERVQKRLQQEMFMYLVLTLAELLNQMPQHHGMRIRRGALGTIDLSNNSIKPRRRKEMPCRNIKCSSVETGDWWAIEKLTPVGCAYIVKAHPIMEPHFNLPWVISKNT